MKNKNNDAWFIVAKKDGKRFLQFAKDSGCVWINGDEICPKTDKCGSFMGMDNHSIGYVSAMIYHYGHEKHKVIDFETIKVR